MMYASEAKQIADDVSDRLFSAEVERIEKAIREQAENGKYQVEVGTLCFAFGLSKLLEECGYVVRLLTPEGNNNVRYSINWVKGGEEDD